MENIPILGSLIKTLNWLTITTPFIAGFAAGNWGSVSGNGKAVPAFVGLSSFLGLIAVWYVLFQWTEFPLWMRWFN
ncbi:MAG: hypothetical protein L3J30_03960 [Marinosulfonomonas sp.]|nr:hypothetical protein [Marinosulfonomonas sp.]